MKNEKRKATACGVKNKSTRRVSLIICRGMHTHCHGFSFEDPSWMKQLQCESEKATSNIQITNISRDQDKFAEKKQRKKHTKRRVQCR